MITKWKVPKYTQINMEIYEKAGNSNQSGGDGFFLINGIWTTG